MPKFKSTLQVDGGLLIPASAGAGKVLKSDASGNGTWGTAPGGAVVYEQADAPATPNIGDFWVETDVDISPVGITGQEGGTDFSATAGDYIVPNAVWGTPGWYNPITVGPNQVWEIHHAASIYCVTAYTIVNHRLAIQSSSGGATPSGVSLPNQRYFQCAPYSGVLTSAGQVAGVGFDRLVTDNTVTDGTVLRLCQEFYGNSNGNGRVYRHGSFYFTQAWRRV